MKTQKKFVTSGMFKRHTILGVCLILVALFALFAPFAHAQQTVDVNPGSVGKEAQNFNFNAGPAVFVDILWTDNKTLEWEAGPHVFVLWGSSNAAYAGILLDAAGNEIPGTELVGEAPGSGDLVSFGAIDLDETTVFSGIRLTAGAFSTTAGWGWNWNSADRPIVGQTQSTAQVITDGDGNVTRIENLPVLDEDTEEPTIYNVDFVYDSAINVYATGEFDFPERQDALLALEAVTDALNAEDTIPPGAGPQGADQFFIGNTEREGLVIALGGQNIEGVWGDCETGEESDCLAGVAVLSPSDSLTYAKFTETQDVPPGPATLISPSGAITENNPTYTWNAVAVSTWYNLIVKDDTEVVIIDSWYTADTAGCGDGTGECSVTPVELLADGLHQWLIQTWNEFGEGPLSDGMSFTVDTTGEKPGPATLISPSGTITVNTPAYTWDAVENSTWYRLFVWDSTETEIIDQWYTADEAGCSDGTVQCSVTPETVLADDSHEWYIRTWNPSGNGPWSDELSFTVDTSSAPIVELDDDGNVTRILNLPVIDENTEETTIYDVDFIYGTVTDVYGSGLDFDFPVSDPKSDEDIFLALAAVNDALYEHVPIPVGAGPQGTDQFFFGFKEESGFIVAAGGEELADLWEPCRTDPCLVFGELQTGVAVLSPIDSFTWADFTVVVE